MKKLKFTNSVSFDKFKELNVKIENGAVSISEKEKTPEVKKPKLKVNHYKFKQGFTSTLLRVLKKGKKDEQAISRD